MAFTMFFLTGLLVYLAVFAVFWVLVNFGLYRMAGHAGIPHPWLALVPVANAYVAGLLADRSLYVRTGRQRRLGLAFWAAILQAVPLVGLMLVMGLALLDSDFNLLVALSLALLVAGVTAGTVVYWYALYNIFRDYAPDNAVLYTVLGLVFGIYWIFLLVERNTVPVSVTGYGAFPYGRPKYDRWHQWQPAGAAPRYSAPAPQGPNTTGWQQPPPPCQGQGPQFYQGAGYYREGQDAPGGDKRDEHQGPEVK